MNRMPDETNETCQPPEGLIGADVLVVDDDPNICAMLEDGICLQGHQCATVGDADQALARLAERSYDVMVTDINMPGMSGVELSREVRVSYDTDIIIMTGQRGEFTYEQIVALGASDFIQKPVPILEFVARLNRVILARRVRQDLNRTAQELEQNLERLQSTLDGVVDAMSRVVEMRDPYTSGHQQRVSHLAAAIAQRLVLPEEQINGIRMIGRIHDIGKVIIPSEILCKPGELNGLEFEMMKNHAKAGYDILNNIEFPWPVADVVLQHHERMDGSGYPNGLTGDSICREARVLAVADVLESMATHRPYRPALGLDSAIEELQRHRGDLYDADAVDACIDLVRSEGFQQFE